MIKDIIPFIERTFPVSKKRSDRAIAGLSMGGIQTLNIALWNPDLFVYVFAMSTGYFSNSLKEFKTKYQNILKNPSINEFKNFTIGMGKQDPLAYQNNKKMMDLFRKFNIHFNYRETEWSNTFLVWRKNLAYWAPLLFRKDNK